VRIASDSTKAIRVDSYCKAIVFSNRPIREKERVYIKLSTVDSTWHGALKFGFTSINPSTYRSGSNLPNYACPDMTNKPGSWAKPLPERFANADSILSFYYTTDGTIHYAVNGEDKGYFKSGVSGANIWALIDIYGNTTGIEMIDPRLHIHHQHNIHNQLRCQSLARRSQSMAVLPDSVAASDDDDDDATGMYESMGRLTISHRERREPLPQVYSNVTLHPLSFHRTRGVNVRLSNDRCVAERMSHYNQGYTFSQRPLQLNEKVVLQVLQTDEMYSGSLTFGLTTCDPANLLPNELPEDSHHLLDRPEYWVIVKDVANGPQPGDELAFEITDTGRVQMTKNKQPPVTLMHVDGTQRFFCFFDLYGSTIKVRVLGTLKSSTPVKGNGCPRPATGGCASAASVEDLYYPSSSLYAPLDVNVNLYGKNSTKAKSSHSVSTVRHPDYAVPMKRNVPPHQMTTHSPCYSTSSRGSSGLFSQVSGGCRTSSLSSISNECTVCFEAPINTVLYICGHMCMCYDCAVKQWKAPGGGQCPICRAHIRDIIRTYRS